MFESHYEFEISERYFNRVDNVTPAKLNREHKHADIEEGLDTYTKNWECIATSTERRRGSDKLYLADDSYYILCSRTGMEKSGNVIKFCKNSPKELRFKVWSTVFENIIKRKVGSIKEGIDKKEIQENDGIKYFTPKNFVLKHELSQEELNMYFDEMADLMVQLISKYHESNSIEELKNITKWYNNKSKFIYRDYIDFNPTITSRTLNNIDGENGWEIPNNIDKGKHLCVIVNNKYEPNYTDAYLEEYSIEINEHQNKIEFIYNHDEEYNILKKKNYASLDELQKILLNWFKLNPNKLL